MESEKLVKVTENQEREKMQFQHVKTMRRDFDLNTK